MQGEKPTEYEGLTMIEVLADGQEMAKKGQFGSVNRRFMLENMMTRREVCEAVRISYRSFSRLRSEGRGPAGTWVGGKLMFSAAEIRRWQRDWTEQSGHPNFERVA
jgi:hypothetical protein